MFSLVFLVTLALLYSSFDVASLSVNEEVEAEAEAEAETDAPLKWKASLHNKTQPPLPSWILLRHQFFEQSKYKLKPMQLVRCFLHPSRKCYYIKLDEL